MKKVATLEKEVNGIEWEIYPDAELVDLDDDLKVFERDYNISVLTDDERHFYEYTYLHKGEEITYVYYDNIGFTLDPDGDERTKEMTFEEFCNIIKKNEEYIHT